MPAGRPTKFKEDYVRQAFLLGQVMPSERHIADLYGVMESTVSKWKIDYPEFSEALKAGKEYADNQVVQSLFRRAMGYDYEEEKAFIYEGLVVKESVKKHMAASVTACIFWLKNRQKENWRDKQEIVHDIGDNLATMIAQRRQNLRLESGGTRDDD